MRLLFWTSVGMVFYAYAGYPVLLLLLAGFHQFSRDFRFAFSRQDRRARATAELPSVSLVFSAYNEQSVIAEKIRNCSELKYPSQRLEILLGCDGCTDGTALRARQNASPNLRVFDFSARRGKPVVLNELVSRATGEIVVFSDANTMLSRDAVTRLARHFIDPRVGCVSGELTFKPVDGGARTEGLYWRYEVFLKFLESRLNMLVGANGGLFALRRELFQPIPTRGIIDDFLIAMGIRGRGYRIVYDPEATALEDAAASVGDEFRRRVRIGAGNFHALRYTWRLLLPAAGLVALAYWSHKVLRWVVPFALVAAFISSIALAHESFHAFTLAVGLITCGLAATGYYREVKGQPAGGVAVPYYFLSMNLALALGLIRCLTGGQMLVWHRTARANNSDEAAKSAEAVQ